jgi:hypothetical protein
MNARCRSEATSFAARCFGQHFDKMKQFRQQLQPNLTSEVLRHHAARDRISTTLTEIDFAWSYREAVAVDKAAAILEFPKPQVHVVRGE